jgi:hypothetical protein
VSRIYELMREGELINFRSGKSRRVLVQSIHEYVGRRLAESGGAWRPVVGQPPMSGRQQAKPEATRTSTDQTELNAG